MAALKRLIGRAAVLTAQAASMFSGSTGDLYCGGSDSHRYSTLCARAVCESVGMYPVEAAHSALQWLGHTSHHFTGGTPLGPTSFRSNGIHKGHVACMMFALSHKPGFDLLMICSPRGSRGSEPEGSAAQLLHSPGSLARCQWRPRRDLGQYRVCCCRSARCPCRIGRTCTPAEKVRCGYPIEQR